MGFLLRRSWSNPNGGSNPELWEKPVNQASKWLVLKAAQKIPREAGTLTLDNNNSRSFLLSVFLGDGGSATIGGASGANTVQVSRAGSTITVRAQPNSGSAVTKTGTTDMPLDRWANVYLKCSASGSNIKIDYLIDFKTGTNLLTTTGLFGNSLTTGGKSLSISSNAGWAWFGATTGGFWGWGGTSTIPITDDKYREAVLSNATWDIDNNPSAHDWVRPDGLRYLRAWLFQGGGGNGGDGGSGANGQSGSRGQDGSSGNGSTGCTSGSDGTAGTDGGAGGDGGRGGNNGALGGSGSAGTRGGPGGGGSAWNQIGDMCTAGAGGTAGSAGSGGAGGAGGAGGRGVMVQLTTTQQVVRFAAGLAGVRGSSGSTGGDGGDGGNGGHTTFNGVTTTGSQSLSTPSIRFGVTEFFHGLGGSEQNGGVVFYYQW